MGTGKPIVYFRETDFGCSEAHRQVPLVTHNPKS